MKNNNLELEIDKLNTIEKNNDSSKYKITEVKNKLSNMSTQIQNLSKQAKKEYLWGAYKSIDNEKLLEIIRELSNHTSSSITAIASISSITNENISDLNKMMRILLNISQSIYFDIITNTKTSADIYKEISNSKSDLLKQDANIKELIHKVIDRALNDKKKHDKLESRIQSLEQTGLVEKNSKYIISGFIFLSLIICALSVFIFNNL
jgi:hypothetical protein